MQGCINAAGAWMRRSGLPDAMGCFPWLFATRRVAPTLVLRINLLPAYVHTRN